MPTIEHAAALLRPASDPTPPHPPPLQLKKALEAVLAQPGARKPTSARFFRAQMQTIISRALADLGINPVPSRRCFALMGERWVRQG